jgi:hypothetical protein
MLSPQAADQTLPPKSTQISRTALDTAAREPERVGRRLRIRRIEGLRHDFARRVATQETLSKHATNNTCIQHDDGDAGGVTVQQR